MRISATALAMFIAAWCGLAAATAFAQSSGPIRIVVTEGVIEPLPLAVPEFTAATELDQVLAQDISEVVSADLSGTGLFRLIPQEAHLSRPTGINDRINFADWKAINAQALIVGTVSSDESSIEVNFRLFDVFAEAEFGQGQRFRADKESWRRIAHRIADTVYQRITGENPYFDSQVAFILESGPKDRRSKQLAIMDYDGANVRILTDGSMIVLAPRFSPNGDQLIYTSYESGVPSIYLLDLRLRRQQAILRSAEMAFAPRFSPSGEKVVLSLTKGANTDIYEVEIGAKEIRRLTQSAAIDTSPSYSPDGKWIAFESDRSGSQQIYVMRTENGEPRRISFGKGRYGTPVWAPTGEYIAFTKQTSGLFHIGIMRVDGSEERLLTASFLDEGPTWAPNGRSIMFFREMPGVDGGPAIWSVDLYGRSLKRVPTPGFGSDPAWSPLRN